MTRPGIWLLDYGSGNVQSVCNAIEAIGFQVHRVQKARDIDEAPALIFPGVGAFGHAVQRLYQLGYWDALRAYLNSGKPFMGICVGMQVLLSASEEGDGDDVQGLGVFDGRCRLLDDRTKSVPHMGWNGALTCSNEISDWISSKELYYFVHSYAWTLESEAESVPADAYTLTRYGDQVFVSSVRRGSIFATQFHPEKSGTAGLAVLKAFLDSCVSSIPTVYSVPQDREDQRWLRETTDRLAKRIIACLDVRSDDQGRLVVTKGDQYDVRERSADGSKGAVRDLGSPVDLAQFYYESGADELTFLNITSFRDCVLTDLPMLRLLETVSKKVFVPMTIGGGIRDMVLRDDEGENKKVSALEVADVYFRAGADKISIGSDAVYAAEKFRELEMKGETMDPSTTSIGVIAQKYGRQAVVISVDPRRVYVESAGDTNRFTIKTNVPGPNGEQFCWYQCTTKGGRDGRDLDVIELVQYCERLGAGEILLNCMDKDGTNSGYDLELINMVKSRVSIPVIASSGAGRLEHFSEVFENTRVDAALAAGIFHRREVPLEDVKTYLSETGYPVRTT